MCLLVVVAGLAGAPTHRVQPGETLSSIAKANHTTVAALVRANGITDPNHILVGRVLRLAAASVEAAVPIASVSPAPEPAATTYTVVRGDTLTSIATRFGTTASALAAANGLRNANVVVLGSRLRVPAPAANPGSGAGTPVFSGSGLPTRLINSPDRLALRPVFDRWAAAYGVPTDLLQALAWMESGWQNGVVSSTKAVGIGQLMPDTVQWMRQLIGNPKLDPTVPSDNIQMSARYLAWLLARTSGDPSPALAGYYQGLKSVQAGKIYADTKQYVAVILNLRPHFA